MEREKGAQQIHHEIMISGKIMGTYSLTNFRHQACNSTDCFLVSIGESWKKQNIL